VPEPRFIQTVVLEERDVGRIKDVIADVLDHTDWYRKGPAEVLELRFQRLNDGRYLCRFL
jgi:hypothetical protein